MTTREALLLRLQNVEVLLRAIERELPRLLPQKEDLPVERSGSTRKLVIPGVAGAEGITCYATLNRYPDGRPGELFLVGEKTGSLVGGLLDALSIAVSTELQWGVPIQDLVQKFRHTRFEPCGFTGDTELPFAASITDLLAQWIEKKTNCP